MLVHSPQVVCNGLVFCYDMSNTKKSWIGKPTSNLIVTTPLGLGVYAYASGPVSTPSVIKDDWMPGTVNRYTITAATNTARARIIPTLTVGQTYSLSFKVKYNGSNTTTPSWYASAYKGYPEATGANTLTNEVFKATPLANNWWLYTYTFTVSASATNASTLCYGINTGTDTNYLNQTFDVCEEQFEVGYPSAYINGSRSTTQALNDLVGGHTITVNSLTYNSDGSFQWNGSGRQSVDSTSADFAVGTLDFSMSAWYMPITATTYPHVLVLGTQAAGMCLKTWRDGIGNDNKVYVFGGGGTYNSDSTVTDWYVTKNVWNHLTVTRSGGVMYCYLNGVLKGSYSNPYSVTSTNLTVGDGVSVSEFVTKRIENVSFYNRALTTTEVLQNFNALRGRYGL